MRISDKPKAYNSTEDNMKKYSDKVYQVTDVDLVASDTDGDKMLSQAEEPLRQQQKKPVDRYYTVYVIFLLHGVGVLMPWNMFINANEYFVKYKLAPSGGDNVTDSDMSSSPSVYQVYFLNVLGFVAQIPNILLNGVNVFCQTKRGNQRTRIIASIAVVLSMFVITVILAIIDSSNWPAAFFWITMTTVVVISMANGIYHNSLYGIVAHFPMKYTNAIIIGNNISGTFTAVVNILSIASAPDLRTSAICYFTAAILILLIAFGTFFIFPTIPFYQYFFASEKRSQESNSERYTRPPYWLIFKQCWVHDLSVFFVFFVTLTCFPALQASIEPVDPNFVLSTKYFEAVTCFLFFNAFAVAGNILSSFIQKPGPRWVWVPVLLRALFIPFFMLCNVHPATRSLPVLFSDYVYCTGAILMAFTSGYFSSLTMMYAPRNVIPRDQAVAGMMAAFFLVVGIFCGVVFATPVTLAVQHFGSGHVVNSNVTRH